MFQNNSLSTRLDERSMFNLYNNAFQYFNFIYNNLNSAELYYPSFKHWYYKKVVPEIISNKRELILERRENNIAGIAIIKNTQQEKKLCTLKIMENFQNKGIGLKLFETVFKCLDTDKPFLTVSEEKFTEFERIFKYYNFELTSVKSNLYRNGKIEYFFNEI